MTRHVLKYPLPDMHLELDVAYRKVVHFGLDGEQTQHHLAGGDAARDDYVPHVWVEVDESLPTRKLVLRVHGTGHAVASEILTWGETSGSLAGTTSPFPRWQHVASCVVPHFVWHLYRDCLLD